MRANRHGMTLGVLLLATGCLEYGHEAALQAPRPPDEDEVPEGYQLDEFQGGGDSTADVIVFGDTSGSMEEELRTLGETITAFVERLATHVDDWQLAAVTGGTGCSPSGVLTPQTNDFADRFADAITEPVGDDTEAEQALRNVLEVMKESGPGECNEGLLRGGLLHIVFVSDENEESPGYDDSPGYWRDWLTQIQEEHGDPSKVILSAVAGPTPMGCSGADPGFGYDGPVAATGGKYISICDDWASEIDLLADVAGERATFPLSDIPAPETIEVWVDDAPVAADGFAYDQPSNTITLDEPLQAGQTISILYEIVQ